MLAARLGVVPTIDEVIHGGATPLLEDESAIAEFLAVLTERSAGNALYATYLCREALRHDATLAAAGKVTAAVAADPAAAVRSFPPFDGTLENYYRYLQTTLGAESGWVADVIALVDFAVTRTELREIKPEMAHRVDAALEVLKPVLVERAAQGGVRVYHESFARFLCRPFQDDPAARSALLDHIAAWLKRKGFLSDSRAFRSLLPILAKAGHDAEVRDLVERNFVTRAVAKCFPASSIRLNLATAIGAAARIDDWPAIVRYVELSRAADTYEGERFESLLVEFADIPMALLGPTVVADRLLHDNRLVMPARAGLQMCAAVDALGAVAPWQQYMTGFLREDETDRTSYGEESDRQVALAWRRGRLRLSVEAETPAKTGEDTAVALTNSADNDASAGFDKDRGARQWNLCDPVDWTRLAEWVQERQLPAPDVVRAILDTYGLSGVTTFIGVLDHPGDMCLALAEQIATGDAPEHAGSARLWASAAVAHGISHGNAHRILTLGVSASHLASVPASETREHLFSLTRGVQQPSLSWEDGHLNEWLDACTIAAHRDHFGLNAAEALCVGDGWYRCWLRFSIELARVTAAEFGDQAHLALAAIHLLTEDLEPFSGEPRPFDLYPSYGVIADTVRRAMALLDDRGWVEALSILQEVSNFTSTTLLGELGGPLQTDQLLRIAIDGATATRKDITADLANEKIEEDAGSRYYADLAEYRLLRSRLALASDDRGQAERLWFEACELLTAYGRRKDITIYELLDPLPTLIAADPVRGRNRVARVQPLCKRVPLHTDGKETRHTRGRWWELLSKADPIALTKLACPRLLRRCNDSNWLRHGALEDLWRAWQEKADPVIAGALRLTLDTPLESRDHVPFARLAECTDGRQIPGDLMTLLLARIDERPVKYDVTNSSELLARDDEHVAQINLVAQEADLPCVNTLREPLSNPEKSRSSNDDARKAPGTSAVLALAETEATLCFPPRQVIWMKRLRWPLLPASPIPAARRRDGRFLRPKFF